MAPLPPTLPQSPPVVEHRRHWYAKEIGVVPLQLPLCATSVWPRSAVPEIEGCTVTTGGTPAAAPPRAPDARIAAAMTATTTMRMRLMGPWSARNVTRV